MAKETAARTGEAATIPAERATAPTVPGFAPGPWRVALNAGFRDGEVTCGVWIEAGEYYSIANLVPTRQVEANAHLIAAAPEMYTALKELTDFGFQPNREDFAVGAAGAEAYSQACTIWRKVLAAIQKAESR